MSSNMRILLQFACWNMLTVSEFWLWRHFCRYFRPFYFASTLKYVRSAHTLSLSLVLCGRLHLLFVDSVFIDSKIFANWIESNRSTQFDGYQQFRRVENGNQSCQIKNIVWYTKRKIKKIKRNTQIQRPMKILVFFFFSSSSAVQSSLKVSKLCYIRIEMQSNNGGEQHTHTHTYLNTPIRIHTQISWPLRRYQYTGNRVVHW